MFGIDFSELMVCLVVALIVLGPERLPEAVRTTSLWIGRLKRSLRETKEEIERQVGIDEIRRQLHTEEMMRTLDNMHDEIESALNYERMGSKPAHLSPSEPVTIEHDNTAANNTEPNLLPASESAKTHTKIEAHTNTENYKPAEHLS